MIINRFLSGDSGAVIIYREVKRIIENIGKDKTR